MVWSDSGGVVEDRRMAGTAGRHGTCGWGPARIGRSLAAALAATLLGVALAQQPETLMTGLNQPQDVLVGPDGTVYVADAGTGNGSGHATEAGIDLADASQLGDTARVIALRPDGTETVLAHLPSLPDPFGFEGAAGLAMVDGSLYAAVSGWTMPVQIDRPPLYDSIVEIRDGTASQVADPWTFETIYNPDGYRYDSHPYRLARGPHGLLWVTDAAANDLLKVDPATGKIDLVTAFAGLPRAEPNRGRNGTRERDPVPTGLVVRDDGSALVALLPGSPVENGASKILRVAPDASISDYATGFTMITDLQVGPDGRLYAVELAKMAQHAPQPDTGALVRVTPQGPDTVLSGLAYPTAVAFTPQGDALITVGGYGPPGSGRLLRFGAVAAP